MKKATLPLWLFATLGLWFCTSLGSTVLAQSHMKFLRWPALSPNGKQVAFSWRGDLWIASVDGMQARRMTVHPAYERMPVWSPDGSKIAFASRRRGNYDVMVLYVATGHVEKLTSHSAHDWPVGWSKDGKRVLFLSMRFRNKRQRTHLFSVSLTMGTPLLKLPLSMADARFSPNGRYMVFVRGNRRWWRKRNKNPNLRHLWLYDFKKKTFRRLTGNQFTADFPSWVNNRTLVYRSEKSGRFNLWQLDLKTSKHTQLTHFAKLGQGIRAVSASPGTDLVVFEQWDNLYLLNRKTKKKRKLLLPGTHDSASSNIRFKVYKRGISEYAVSPNGREVAFVIKGNVYVKGLKSPEPWAKTIEGTSWRARELTWSPDGKVLAFASDSCGYTCIQLVYAGKRKGRTLPLHKTPLTPLRSWIPVGKKLRHDESNPKFSPDGKWLAYVKGAGALMIRSLDRKKTRMLVNGWNLGNYHWSPDSRWIAFTRMDRESNTDVFLTPIRGGRPYNLSRHPDSDFRPVWSANGRVFAYLSRDVNNRSQIHAVFLRKKDHDLTKVELKEAFRRWSRAWKRKQIRKRKARIKALLKARKARKKARKARKKGVKGKLAAKAKARPTTRPVAKKAKKGSYLKRLARRLRRKARKARLRRRKRGMRVSLRGLAFRLRRISVPGIRGASQLAINAVGSAFYVVVRGRKDGGLYKISWSGRAKKLARGYVKQVSLLSKGRIAYLGRGGTLMLLRRKRPRPLRFRAGYYHNDAKERLQKFNEAWALVRRWFYDPKFHGIDWNKTVGQYSSLVHTVKTNEDFDDVINMMVGELNASHMGMYTLFRGQRTKTGDIGLRFDASYKGLGLRVSYVRPKGPATRRQSRIRRGEILTRVNGRVLNENTNLYTFLNWHIGRPVYLTVKNKQGKERLVTLRPVSRRKAFQQRYASWVRRRRALVRRWSGGLLGYAHIYSMGMSSLAKFERDLFAHAYGKKGLLLDVRNNGGGWTTDRVLTMFRPKPHAYTRWKGSKKGYPAFRRSYYFWNRPVTLLSNQRSFSNAEIFSHAFRNLKLGTIVGMPTGGGVISTRWMRLMDGSYFGVPLRGWWTLPGKVNMENNAAQPHIRVPMSPAAELKGKDPQLFKAVYVLLKQLEKKSRKK